MGDCVRYGNNVSVAESSPLRVRLLGGLAIDGLADAQLGSRKARTLIKVLALAYGSPVSTAALADVLWGGDLPARPTDQIGVLVSRLRKILGAARLSRSDAGFALHVDWLDVAELRHLVEEAGAEASPIAGCRAGFGNDRYDCQRLGTARGSRRCRVGGRCRARYSSPRVRPSRVLARSGGGEIAEKAGDERGLGQEWRVVGVPLDDLIRV